MDKREKRRLKQMWKYENDALSRGFSLIAGVDEAGRGPLAGPVVAAAVVLPPGLMLENCDDSKRLCPELRSLIYDKIIGNPDIATGTGIVSPEEIDRMNILRATIRAMTLAVMELKTRPDYVLVDGLSIPALGIENRQVIKGDSKSLSIAAASIVAKQTRDSIMKEYDKAYGEYGFAKHKGYGTSEHLESLRKHGPSPIHRKTFLPVRRQYEELDLWQTG